MVDVDLMVRAGTTLMLGLPRMIVALSMLPMFSRQAISISIRSMVAVVFVLPILPTLWVQVDHVPGTMSWLAVVIFKEAALGICLAMVLAVPFWIAEGIGFLIDNQRGASMASIFNAQSGNETSPLGILLNLAYVVFFLSAGGLTLLLDAVYGSYSAWPVASLFPNFDIAFARHYLNLMDRLIGTTVLLGAPVMIALLLAELALALVSMFTPQLQVFFLAMPIKSGVALFVLLMYFSLLIDVLINTHSNFSAAVRALGALPQ